MDTPSSIILAKAPLPTELDSAEIRARWSSEIRSQSIFSSTTAELSFLQPLQQTLSDYAQGTMNLADARLQLLDALDAANYSPAADANTIKDLTTQLRLNMIVRTNQQVAASMAQMAVSDDPIVAEMFPAYELASGSYRKVHRADWAVRWAAAGKSCAWKGALQDRMIALKDSPIWAALGSGEGGFQDTLGNPYPPFAWGSSFIWMDVDRSECKNLGLVHE